MKFRCLKSSEWYSLSCLFTQTWCDSVIVYHATYRFVLELKIVHVKIPHFTVLSQFHVLISKASNCTDHSVILKEVNVPLWRNDDCERALKFHFWSQLQATSDFSLRRRRRARCVRVALGNLRDAAEMGEDLWSAKGTATGIKLVSFRLALDVVSQTPQASTPGLKATAPGSTE
ncbi:hypothetical protein CEXT_744681 [Caerostris extrusa]|uniref:Uncharacterized protein n=1 Tax=Caerostris extrusa TaxID=172846 RepID=A0AAV4WI81_CAEEX|nr:hypothetical protein CEXT_744681 [Caerostris extrusa]